MPNSGRAIAWDLGTMHPRANRARVRIFLGELPMDPIDFNRRAWARQVAKANPWTVPVTAAVVARARAGFPLRGFYDAGWPGEKLAGVIRPFVATLAVKP